MCALEFLTNALQLEQGDLRAHRAGAKQASPQQATLVLLRQQRAGLPLLGALACVLFTAKHHMSAAGLLKGPQVPCPLLRQAGVGLLSWASQVALTMADVPPPFVSHLVFAGTLPASALAGGWKATR